jgi:uncharacterized protein
MKLLKRRPRTFEIQVQDMTLHIQAATDFNEESRAAALSFWEQLHAYTIRNPAFSSARRPIDVPADAPDIVREMVSSARRAGVGPMFSFQGAVTDHVGRFLARDGQEVTVNCGVDYFIRSRKRQKLTVVRRPGSTVAVVVPSSKQGVGVSMSSGGRSHEGAARGNDGHGSSLDGLAVLAESCMLADAAAAGVHAILAKEDGFGTALGYLKKVDGVFGGLVISGERIGMMGSLEIAA